MKSQRCDTGLENRGSFGAGVRLLRLPLATKSLFAGSPVGATWLCKPGTVGSTPLAGFDASEAQDGRAPVSYSGGCGFDPRQGLYAARSSSGQDSGFSSREPGFDSPAGHRGSSNGRTPAFGTGYGGSIPSPRIGTPSKIVP